MVRRKSRWMRLMATLLVCGMVIPVPALPGGAAAAEVAAVEEVLVKNTTTTTDVNLSLTATASADSQEADNLSADKAKDGINDNNSRWASSTSGTSHWLQLAWDTEQTIKTVNIHWERTNATSYKLQKSEDGTSWEDVKTFSTAPASHRQRIVLDNEITTKYLRLQIDAFNPTGVKEDGTEVTWNTVSVFELETYATIPAQSPQEIADNLELLERIEKETATFTLPEVPEGFTVNFIGADYEQIIARDCSVYHPLVDKTVKMNFEIVRTSDNLKATSKEYSVVVAGRETPAETDNAKPAVIPELAEWKGGSGNFEVTDSSRIVVATKDKDMLSPVAEEFKADYEDITGKTIEIAYADTANAGDFFLTLQSAETEDMKLDKEGYYMTIGDKVEVKAEENAGIYWSTRTILQILKQNGTTIPQGTTRDYPKYEVRGFMLDIGRRPFSKKIVDEVAKNMAWYKMNDFQLHLNDNYIFLEDYATSEGAMTAYEGFRLESSIKEGGLNQADLTSHDIYYTKDEMRTMIQDYRKLGINVVPEIDTPAHSLSLTKVRPDLRMGTNGRENDHLNLDRTENGKYDESLEFVKSIWDEYLEGDNRVFDEETIINIGTDEYSATFTEEFRKFTDDMLQYAQSKVERVRLWGSLTSRAGTTSVRSESDGTGLKGAGVKVEMMMWNRGWANPKAMYDQGYAMVDINDGNVYIVPAAGYYYDYLGKSAMYSYDPGKNMGLPTGSEQVLGGSYAIWNDMVDKKANGLSEMEIYDRFYDAAGMIACGLWGGNSSEFDTVLALRDTLGAAPRTNAYDEVESTGDTVVSYEFEGNYEDSSENGYDAKDGSNTAVEDGQLSLKGDASWAETPIEKIGSWGDGKSLSFDIELTEAPQPGDILFEADAEYEIHNIRIMDDGCLGFSREGYDYTFGYEIPLNEKVTLTIEASQGSTTLYSSKTGKRAYAAVGSFTYEGNVKATGLTKSALSLPLERIGSKTNAITAKLDNIVVGAIEEWDKDGKAIPSTDFTVTADNQQSGEGIDKAFDNNPETKWHSQWSPSKVELPAEIIIDMKQDYAVDGIYYQTRTDGSNGNITKFSLYYENENGEWIALTEDARWSSDRGEKTMFFDPAIVSKIKMVVKEGVGGFGSAMEIKLLEADHFDFAAVAEGSGTATVSQSIALPGTQVTFQATANEGFEFKGWYNAEGSLVSKDATYLVTAGESMTLTAKFLEAGTEVTFKVTIDGEERIVNEGDTITKPADPTKEGHKFLGWEIASTGELFDFATPITSDLVLNAKFEKLNTPDTPDSKVTFTVTIDGEAIIVNQGETVKKPADPTKEGHKFLGWEVKSTGKIFDFTTPITSDLVLTAKFEKLPEQTKQTVAAPKFSVNGGTYNKAQSVTLTSSTAGATIYYTTDGSTPTTKSNKYSKTINVSKSMTIKAIAVKSGMTNSSVATAVYVIKVDKPWIFEDVKQDGGWKHKSVKYVYNNDIMGAITGTKQFQPDRNLERAMLPTMLYRMAGSPKVTYNAKFKDVPSGKYFSDPIIWANQNKIVEGYTDGNFGVTDFITREQLAKMLYEYAKRVAKYEVDKDKKDLTGFTDIKDVSGWATEYMKWATGAGIITGKPNDDGKTMRMDPKGLATRAECAAMLERFAAKYEQ